MNTETRNVVLIIIATIIAFAGVMWFLKSEDAKSDRQGTEELTAEQVIDLEVQAEQEYLKTQQGQ